MKSAAMTSILLMKALAAAAPPPDAIAPPLLPWITSPPGAFPVCRNVVWWLNEMPLRKAEQKCGTGPVCSSLRKLPWSRRSAYQELLGFSTEAACFRAHEPPPTIRCELFKANLFQTPVRVTREAMDRVCGVGAFCRLFGAVHPDRGEDWNRLLAIRYGYGSVDECTVQECALAKQRVYDSAEPLPRDVVDEPCGHGSFCALFSPGITGTPGGVADGPAGETAAAAKLLGRLYGYGSAQECRAGQCEQAKRIFNESERAIDRELVDRPCGPKTFCTLFDTDGQTAVPTLDARYGFRGELDCRRKQCERRKQAMQEAGERLDPWTVDMFCDKSEFCNAFGEGESGAALGSAMLRLSRLSRLSRLYDYRDRKTCVEKTGAECDRVQRLLLNVTDSTATAAMVDGACGGGTFCRYFGAGDLDRRTLEHLRDRFGYRSEEDCNTVEAWRIVY